tara:strand:- start:1293 stop:1994 length:702 start_codon:yes stop_codon:yes gene_type:complete
MRSSSVNKTFIFISSSKFIIISLNEANKINYKKETIFKDQNKKFDLDLFDKFLNENIFKIEKELGEFIKVIYLIIENEEIFSVNLSIKNKINETEINTKIINNLLIEAKNNCEETLKKAEVIHMKIDQFYIDNEYYKVLPDKVSCKSLSLDLSFVCVPNNILNSFDKVLNKFQISVYRTISYEYLHSFLKISSNNLELVAQKILTGFNENEVILTNKSSKNIRFFEKFFNFFN